MVKVLTLLCTGLSSEQGGTEYVFSIFIAILSEAMNELNINEQERKKKKHHHERAKKKVAHCGGQPKWETLDCNYANKSMKGTLIVRPHWHLKGPQHWSSSVNEYIALS